MPRPKTMIALGLLQVALFGGLTLQGLLGADSGGPAAAGPMASTGSAGASPAGNVLPGGAVATEQVLAQLELPATREGSLCGATSDALRCRTSRD